MSTEDALILKGQRLLIPESLREDILEQLHYGHHEIGKPRLRARESVFWPNINKDIEQMTKSCPICQEHQPAPANTSLLSERRGEREWGTWGRGQKEEEKLGKREKEGSEGGRERTDGERDVKR